MDIFWNHTMHKNSQLIVGSSLTHQEQKDTFANYAAHGRLIVLLFHPFEIAYCPHPKKYHLLPNE